MPASEQHTNNILIGAGEAFINLEDSDGDLQGERYLGDTVSCSITTNVTRQTVFSGDGPVARKLLDKVVSKEEIITIVLRDMSMENLALMLGVDVSDAAIAATGAAGATLLNVKYDNFPSPEGVWVTLGQTDAAPHGVGEIGTGNDFKIGASNAEVAAAGTTFATLTDAGKFATDLVKDTDYVIDAENGRVLIKNTAKTKGKYIGIGYKATAKASNKRASVISIKDIRAAIRYIEDSENKGRKVYARRCSISASGETQLKSRDTEQRITLTCGVQAVGGGKPQVVIEGEDAA